MIPFTQFLRPDGRIRKTGIERPLEIEAMAKALVGKGVGFEIEELVTGIVSMEALIGETVLAIELVPNGPDVPAAVDKLVKSAYKEWERGQ